MAAQLKGLANLLGLLARSSEDFMQAGSSSSLDVALIEAQIFARSEAKKAKDFAEADRIRKDLLDQGIILEDNSQGTIWRR